MTLTKGGAPSDPRNIVWSVAYGHEGFRNYMASALTHFGLTEVYRATVFIRLKETQDNWAKHGPEHMDDERRHLMTDLMADHLVDDFRIVTFFENWMKAMLLREVVIIHQFKDNKDEKRFKQLKKQQKAGPMSVSNIPAWSINEADFSSQTIGMWLLLSPAYQQVIKLPADIHKLVEEINDRRNRVHFNSYIEFGMGPSVLEEYDALLKFISKTQHFWKEQRFGFGPLPLLGKKT